MWGWFPAPASQISAMTSVCVDKDPRKIDALNRGEIPIFEPGLSDLVAKNVRENRLSFTSNLPDAVRDGRGGVHRGRHAVAARRRPCRPHLRQQAAREIAAALDGYTVIVTKSTVPVGTGDEVERIIREVRPEADFAVVSNPEFLREGAAITDFKRPDRIVIGTEDERAANVMRELYRPLYLNQSPLLVTVAAHGGTDQIRRQRLPRHQDHLHQRDRRSLRAGRRQRAGRGARHRPRQPHRRASSCMPARAMAARASRRTRWR